MPIDTLIIIGNGFDIWQGISTSYADFEKYYIAHLPDILKRLHIKPWEIEDEDGTKRIVSDVEMLYGNPFNPYYLDSDFWYRYEDSLALIDDQQINLYFGKEKEDLERIALLAENSRRILKEAFSGWIGSKDIESKDSGFTFPENCFVINFNYTDTVEARFHVPVDRVCHIHGESTDKESIIVGHSLHSEYALPQMANMGGRFTGLFFIEDALYQSDKHVDDNYQELAMDLAVSGADLKNIKNVYVLGHSFGDADYGYFYHLAHAMNDIPEDPFEGFLDWVLEYLAVCDEMSFLNLNIEYAIHHRERLGKNADIKELPGLEALKHVDQMMESATEDQYYTLSLEQQRILENAAVRARFIMEQTVRDMQRELEFMDIMSEFMGDVPKVTKGKRKKIMKQLEKIGWKDCQEMIRDTLNNRKKRSDVKTVNKEAPFWHISYYSEADKERIENVMNQIHYSNYKLYSSISDCLDRFRTARV